MKIPHAFFCILILLLGASSCIQPAGNRIITSVSELPLPAVSLQAATPLHFQHSFNVLSPEVLKERVGRIQYMSETEDELTYDKLTGESKKLQQVTREQAIEDINYLFLVLKHGYAGYGLFNQNDAFSKAQTAISDELEKMDSISRDQLLTIITGYLSFIDTGSIKIGGKGFFTPSKYYYWDKLDFAHGSGNYYYQSSKGAVRLISVNGLQPSDFMKLSLNNKGDPAYQLGVLAKANPGKFTLGLVGEDGTNYCLSDNWADSPFSESNPFYSRSKQDGVTIIAVGSLNGKAEEVQSFNNDAKELKKEPFIIVDLRGNSGGNSGIAADWVTNLTGSEPVWPDTYTVLTTRTTLAGSIASYAANPNLPKEYTDEALAKLKSLTDGKEKRGWSELEVPTFSTIPNSGQLIVVLVDRRTGGADVFAKYLKQLNNVVIIGENTFGGGIFGDNTRYLLPNSGLTLILQYKIFAPTDFNNSSDISLKPDLWVPAADALPRVLAAIKKGWLQPGD
jgi:hypothetical protein